MNIGSVLAGEGALALIATVIGGIWTAFKSSNWFQRRRQRRIDRAIEFLEAGVEETYRTYVRALKAAREDGKLTEAERRRARELARHHALRLARNRGVNLLRDLGGDFVDLWIDRLVQRRKAI